MSTDAATYAAIAAFLGHLYPIWLKFKGGKGVATALGILIALLWPVGLLVMATWLVTAKLFHYSSVAALVAFSLAPLYVALFAAYNLIGLTVIIATLIFWKHRENIKRLLNGTESQIGQKSNELSIPG